MPPEATEKARSVVAEFAGLGEEFAKYLEALNLEKETKLEISRCLQETQTSLSKEVSFDAKPLKKWFPGADGAVLEGGTNLVITKGKKRTVHSVLELDPDPYLAVVRAVGVEVAKLTAAEDEQKRAREKPVLQAFTRLAEKGSEPFDWRNHELTLANTGGPARKVRLSLSAEGREWYGPVDVEPMEKVEIELGKLSKVRESKALRVELWCEDARGRSYSAKVELEPHSKAVKIFDLAPDAPGADAPPGPDA